MIKKEAAVIIALHQDLNSREDADSSQQPLFSAF